MKKDWLNFTEKTETECADYVEKKRKTIKHRVLEYRELREVSLIGKKLEKTWRIEKTKKKL